MNLYLLLPILFPVVTGILLGCLPRTKNKSKHLNTFVILTLVIEFALCISLCFADNLRLVVCQITPTLPILLKGDGFAKLFVVLASSMWLLCGIYSQIYMTHEENQSRFFCFYLCTLGALVGTALAGNFVSFYLFFECMSFLSMPLVLHSGTTQAIQAAKKYLYYSVFGAALALLGGFFAHAYCASGEFVPGGSVSLQLVGSNKSAFLLVSFLAVVGFGAKAGLFPLHGWLPTAHPVAPAPASALLSGVITKVGVLGIIRYVYYMVGPAFFRDTWVQYGWLTLALITIFMGSMLAYKEKLFKKRLAYSSVSQVSYVLLGVFCLNPVAMLGALLHLVFHSIMKNGLFLSAGSVIYQTGETDVRKLSAMGKKMPITMWCFTLTGLSLVGIPPLCGVVSKWFLAQGSLQTGLEVYSWLAPVVLLVSALLTAGYLFPISVKAFLPGADTSCTQVTKREVGMKMWLPMVLLAGATLYFGAYPTQLMSFFNQLITTLF